MRREDERIVGMRPGQKKVSNTRVVDCEQEECMACQPPTKQRRTLTVKYIERDGASSCAYHRVGVLEEAHSLRVQREACRRVTQLWGRCIDRLIGGRIVPRSKKKEMNCFVCHGPAARQLSVKQAAENRVRGQIQPTEIASSKMICNTRQALLRLGQRGKRSSH